MNLEKSYIDPTVGQIVFIPENMTIPSICLPLDGRFVSRFEFPELFEVMGYIYGKSANGDFKLPDTRINREKQPHFPNFVFAKKIARCKSRKNTLEAFKW